jgi:iron-sulfur cluster insertion protein
MIEITNRAAAEIKSLLSTEGISEPAIRIYKDESTADAQYGLALADDRSENDVTMENNGIKIVMEKNLATGFSKGSIDFVVDKNGKYFIIQNPESGTCGNCEECNTCDEDW